MKRKINVQKVFNAVSIVFLSACALYYGIRFLTLYIKNERKMSIEANTLGNQYAYKEDLSDFDIKNDYNDKNSCWNW